MGKDVISRSDQAVETSKEVVKSGLNPENIWEENDYIPIEDFAKYGQSKKSRKAKKWSSNDFYKALHDLKPHKKDLEDVDNPKVCLVKASRTYTPCYVVNTGETFATGDSTTYFKKERSKWGFKHSTFPIFVKRYYKQIDKLVSGYVSTRVEEKQAMKDKKHLMKKYNLKSEADFIRYIMSKEGK